MTKYLGSLFLAIALPFGAAQASLLPLPSLLADSKWKLVEETDATLNTPVCRATTQTSNSKEPLELSLVYPKDGKLLPMMVLKTKLAPSQIDIKISSSVTEHFFLLTASPEANLFWYAPQGFSRMEENIRANNFLNVVIDPKGTPVQVAISLAGSSNTLDATKKCLKTTTLPADFFKLLNAQKENFLPDLGDRSPAFLFQTVQDAYNSYLRGQGIQQEIAKLRKPMQPLLDKEKAALDSRKSAADSFKKAEDKLNTAKNLVSTLTSNLAEAKANLAALQKEKPLAEADLAAKKAIYTPLKAQMVPYEQAVVQAAAAVNSIQAEISKNENIIAKNSKRIPELERESASLQRAIPGLERQLRELRSEYDQADSNYRRYDPRREKEDLLNRDSWYSWAKRDLDNARSRLSRGQSTLSMAQSRVGDAQRALGACRAVPNQNCSAQESALNSANSEVSSAQNEVWQAQNEISSAERKIRDIEDTAERKVNDESNRLRRIRDDASSAVDSKQREVSNAYDRIAEIRRAIPVLRDQIAKAQAALPGLNTKLSEAKATLLQKTDTRDAFAQQIGFDVAEANYTAATKHLKDVNDGIASNTKAIPQLTKDLAAAQKTIDPLTKSFTAAQAALAAAEAKLVPIQEQLKVFRAQEAVLLAGLEAESNVFKGKRAAYQDLVAELIR